MRSIHAMSLAALIAAPALADVDNDFVRLEGEIDYQCDVTFLGQATTTINMAMINLPQPIGQVRYVCNDPQGFVTKVLGQNNGVLRAGAYSRAYTATLSAGDVTSINFENQPLNPTGVSGTATGFQPAAADADGDVHNFFITLQAGGPLPGGVLLQDAITFELDGRQ